MLFNFIFVSFIGISCGSFLLTIVLDTVVEMAAAQGDDGVGAANGPEHAGLLRSK